MKRDSDEYTAAAEKREKKEKYHKMLEAHGISRRYWGCTFDGIKNKGIPAACQKEYDKCWEYARNFAEYQKKGIGILMMGPVGTMKTSLSAAIAHAVIRQRKSVQFVPMAELLDQMLKMSRNPDPAEYMNFENRIRTADLLIIDDLGAEYPTAWARNKVDAIITGRYNRMLPMIVTTNLDPGSMKDTYIERTYDRLKGTSLVMRFSGESLRKAPEEG